MFMKNASASGSSKSQMLPSLLPLPASFFKVLPPFLQKFNRFHRFRILDFYFARVYFYKQRSLAII